MVWRRLVAEKSDDGTTSPLTYPDVLRPTPGCRLLSAACLLLMQPRWSVAAAHGACWWNAVRMIAGVYTMMDRNAAQLGVVELPSELVGCAGR